MCARFACAARDFAQAIAGGNFSISTIIATMKKAALLCLCVAWGCGHSTAYKVASEGPALGSLHKVASAARAVADVGGALDVDITKLQKCYRDEAERLKRQAATEGGVDILGAMFSWVPLAEPFVQAAQGGVHIAHEVENADADNCEQMGAEMTLNKIGNVQEVLQGDISDLQGDISDLQNTVEAGQKETKELVLKSLQQAKAGQQKLYDMEQRIQSKFMEAAMQVSGLAAQLEDVLRGIEETKEIVELTTYKELSASFTSAVATSSGAYDDVLVALGEMYQQKLKFNIVSKEAVKDWQESTKQMRLIMQGRLQDIWVRSRDSFAEAVTLLTKGDFLAMHYTMLLQSKAILHMEKVQKRARRVYSDWFISHLQKDLEQDELMTTIEAMLLRILSVHAMLGKVFPGGLAMGMLQQQVSGLHEYVIQLKKRLQSESFLHHILYIPMLAKFSPPASSPCVVAAKKAGYQTESLFQWERHSGFKHDSQIRRRGIVRRQSLWEVPLQRKAMPDIEILLLSPAKVYKDPKAAEYFTCSWKKLIEKGTMSDKISQPSDSGDLHMWNKVDSFPAPRDRDTTIRKYMWESDGNVTLTCPESYGTWPGRFSYGPPGQNSVKFEACSQTAEHWLTWTRRRRASRKFKGDDWRANPVYTCNRTAEPHQWSFRLDVACHLLEEVREFKPLNPKATQYIQPPAVSKNFLKPGGQIDSAEKHLTSMKQLLNQAVEQALKAPALS